MMKLTCSILMPSNNFFYNFFYIYIFFFTYIKIPKDSSAKYYRNNKIRLQKKLVKDIKVVLKKKEIKNYNMVVNDIEINQMMKQKSLLSIEKSITK